MARFVLGKHYKKRAAKALPLKDRLRADRYLEKLAKDPPPGDLNFKPMEGTNRQVWECRAGGQNRFILRLARDEQGAYFVIEDVGPHDIYKQY